MRILVTGGTGFFGRAIVKRLKSAGHEVTGAARRTASYPMTEHLDVASPSSCLDLMRRVGRCDAVVHAAAIAHVRRGGAEESACRLVNAAGAKFMIEASLRFGVRRFIFISSVKVYGEHDHQGHVTEAHPVSPVELYGNAKRDAEGFCLREKDGIEVYILRMAAMYGRDWFFNIRKRAAPPLLGRLFYVAYERRKRRFSFCADENGAEAVLRAAEGRIEPGVYNVADHYDYCQDEILEALRSSEGARPSLPLPRPLPRLFMKLSRRLLPPSISTLLYSRYWRFCGHSLYSSEKLLKAGFHAPPLLLELRRAGR